MRALWVTALITFVVDQISKWFVVHHLDLITLRSIDVLPPLLNFRMAWNYGINFGLFSGDDPRTRYVLIAIAFGIVGFVLWWCAKESMSKAALIAAGLLVGGALGNVIDRFVYGAVADFLNMSCCGIDNPFAFNVADIAVFAGAIGLVFLADTKKAT